MRRGPGVAWVVLLGALCALKAQDAGFPTEIWDGPEFKKGFLGTYGIHADVEPSISTEERALLEKIYREAAENLEVVWRMGQGTADAMNLLGDVYVNEELPNLAATAYTRSLEAGPDQDLARPLRNAEVLLLLVGLGKYPEALQLLRRSQEIAPSEQVARYIEQVERASRASR